MSANYDLKTDLKEATAMASGLADYVRGSELYGQTGGGFFSQMPSLTIGALLLRLRRLDVLRDELNGKQIKELDEAMDTFEHVRKEWRLHYEEKVKREAESRIDAMSTFFKECYESMQNCQNNYRVELLRRTIVQELQKEMEDLKINDPTLATKIRSADGKLRGVLREDEFQWAEALRDLYPKEDFWWLYQKPPQQ